MVCTTSRMYVSYCKKKQCMNPVVALYKCLNAQLSKFVHITSSDWLTGVFIIFPVWLHQKEIARILLRDIIFQRLHLLVLSFHLVLDYIYILWAFALGKILSRAKLIFFLCRWIFSHLTCIFANWVCPFFLSEPLQFGYLLLISDPIFSFVLCYRWWAAHRVHRWSCLMALLKL